MDEFTGVPSSALKSQIRGVDADLKLLEHESLWLVDDEGREYTDTGTDYAMSDLAQRRAKLKCELAKRLTGNAES